MIELRFTWDEKKNRLNIRKHGVSFEEAQTESQMGVIAVLRRLADNLLKKE